MHEAQNYIRTQYIVGDGLSKAAIIGSAPLTAGQEVLLRQSLANDALSYFYSSVVSYADAIRGLNENFYSWSIVKMYYSTFYALRSILAAGNCCLFYVGTKAFSIDVSSGKCPEVALGNTHKAVFDLYTKKNINSSLVTQPIDGVTPFEWLTNNRELANYRNAKFCEPNLPGIFIKCGQSIQNNITAYINDEEFIYAFDKEHAMLAYPTEVLKEARRAISNNTLIIIDDDDKNYLSSILNDKSNPITKLIELVVS